MKHSLARIIALTAVATMPLRVSADYAFATNFAPSAAVQETPVWCWAACIQMLMNYQGINWTQADVVTAIKGYTAAETASETEIFNFLNQWGFDHDTDRWKSRCAYYPGPPRPDWLVNELIADRPMIVSYMTSATSGHVVILYEVDYTRAQTGPLINFVRIFDPWNGESRWVPGAAVGQQTTGHWFVDIDRIQQ